MTHGNGISPTEMLLSYVIIIMGFVKTNRSNSVGYMQEE